MKKKAPAFKRNMRDRRRAQPNLPKCKNCKGLVDPSSKRARPKQLASGEYLCGRCAQSASVLDLFSGRGV